MKIPFVLICREQDDPLNNLWIGLRTERQLNPRLSNTKDYWDHRHWPALQMMSGQSEKDGGLSEAKMKG